MTDITFTEITEPRSKKTAILNGLKGKCPRCGSAPLFRSYLKPVDHCACCDANWINVRADDAPAWATMLIVGHLLAPLFHYLAFNKALPIWAPGLILVAAGVILSLIILPRAKGGFMGLIWAGQIPTS